jgi:radical SAM superfamily enzyme YgiQ (UPF0313 family)
MKILLIDVGTSRKELNEPLGIEVIAGSIRYFFPKNVQVDMEYYQLLENIDLSDLDYLFQYDIISISTQLFSLERVEKIINKISNKIIPKKPVVILGGLLSTFAYEYFLNKYPDVICVIGEGEEAIISILKICLNTDAKRTDKLKGLLATQSPPNIAFFYNDDIFATPRKLVDLEKTIRPARDFLSTIIKKKGIIRIEGSRGCAWGKCSFCAISAKYGFISWRPFPIKMIIDELEEISKSGGKSPYFTDEDFFGLNPNRALEIAENIIIAKNDGRIRKDLDFYVNMPINAVISYEKILKRLKISGLREVFIGVESGAKSQIVRYKKNETKTQNLQALNILRNLGLSMDIGFIMFDPEMSFNDLKENVNFITQANLINHDARDIKKVRVEPKTNLEKILRKKGVITSNLDVNGLRYPYNFADSSVQKVYDLFNEWENGTRDIVYTLQGQMRGEIESEVVRREQKKLLGQFRELDYFFLQACIASMDAQNKVSVKDNFEGLFKTRNELIDKCKSWGFCCE